MSVNNEYARRKGWNFYSVIILIEKQKPVSQVKGFLNLSSANSWKRKSKRWQKTKNNLISANYSGFHFLPDSSLLLPGGTRSHRVCHRLFFELLGASVRTKIFVCCCGSCRDSSCSDKRRFTVAVLRCIGLSGINKQDANIKNKNHKKTKENQEINITET